MTELIQQIAEFKRRDNFPVENWEERGLNPSNEETRRGMNLAVSEFADFLISHISTGVVEPDAMREKVQHYFDERDNYEFDTEEREYIVDVQCEMARLVKVECGDLLI